MSSQYCDTSAGGTWYMTENDLIPAISMFLDGTNPLTGETVTFIMAQIDGVKRIEAQATILDPIARQVAYVWQSGDTDTPGVYRAAMRENTANGPSTFPSDEPLYIVIRPSL